MIHVEKRKNNFRVKYSGDGGQILEEIAALVHSLYQDGCRIDPGTGEGFKLCLQELVEDNSSVWKGEGVYTS